MSGKKKEQRERDFRDGRISAVSDALERILRHERETCGDAPCGCAESIRAEVASLVPRGDRHDVLLSLGLNDEAGRV